MWQQRCSCQVDADMVLRSADNQGRTTLIVENACQLGVEAFVPLAVFRVRPAILPGGEQVQMNLRW